MVMMNKGRRKMMILMMNMIMIKKGRRKVIMMMSSPGTTHLPPKKLTLVVSFWVKMSYSCIRNSIGTAVRFEKEKRAH